MPEKQTIALTTVNKIGICLAKLRGLSPDKRVTVSASMIELRTLLGMLSDSHIQGDELMTVIGGLTAASAEATGIVNKMGAPSQMINDALTQIKEGL